MRSRRDVSFTRTSVTAFASFLLLCFSVEDLQTELDDARLEGAGNLATATGCCGALRATDITGQIEVSVVEEVVELCAKFDIESLDWRNELLIDREIRLVERRTAARIATCVTERAQRIPIRIFDRR